MPSSGSASSAATIPRPSPWSPPAARGRCTAPTWRARWAASARCCRAPRAPSAPWACCSPTCGRIICRSSWPISTRSTAPALDAGFAELEARARDALGREGFRRPAAIEREVDLRYDGQQWPVRVALGRGFDAAAARAGIRGRASAPVRPHPARRPDRHHRAARRSAAAARLDAARRALAAGRAAQAARDSARSGSIPAHGWRDVPVYDGADLRPGCKLDGPLLIEERTTTAFVGPRDRLEVDARDDFLVHVGATA